MRVPVLSILVIAVCLLAVDARAQGIPMRDDFASTSYPSVYGVSSPLEYPTLSSFEGYSPEYRNMEWITRSGTQTIVPVGDGFFVHQSSSFYPVQNTKLRYESAFIGHRIDDSTLLMLGVWRTKYGREGQPTLGTEPTYGFNLTYTPRW